MKVELVVQDNNTGKHYDVTHLSKNIAVETRISGQPGKLTFEFIRTDDNRAFFYEGSPVYLRVDDKGIFYGYVFTKRRNQNQIITVTAYDQLRYLRNKDTRKFENMTSSEIFKEICSEYDLRHQVMDESSYKIQSVIHDNKALASMIQEALDMTLAYDKKWFIIRENYGTLEHVNLESLRTDFVLGDGNLLTGYEYESSIHKDVYNQVKLMRNAQDGKTGKPYIVQDSTNITKWGLLQYHDLVDENVNDAQIMEKAEKLLSIHNRVRRSLMLECLGDFRIQAGTGLKIKINKLGEIDLNQNCTVKACRHLLQGNLHKMQLEVNLWLGNV